MSWKSQVLSPSYAVAFANARRMHIKTSSQAHPKVVRGYAPYYCFLQNYTRFHMYAEVPEMLPLALDELRYLAPQAQVPGMYLETLSLSDGINVRNGA